ncbi:MAG: molecular chaperone [Flavipsychrobacter sp.]|jgi:P pilus assembly chaperone PapD|nr:molecular chaperone [Flavipsychrobacter sp.]
MQTEGSLKIIREIGEIKYLALITALLVLVLISAETTAQGLLVLPRRVVFEGTKRTQELNLANSGMDTAKYTISIIEIKMNDDGTFEQVTDTGSTLKSLSKHLRIFPRTVILGPNEAQTIKIHLTNGGKLAEGEYRSHIYIKALPKEKPEGKQLKRMVSNLSLKLTPVFGLTVPVIARIGQYSGSITFSETEFQMVNDSPKLNLVLNRTGSMSTYGNLAVDYVPTQGELIRLEMVKGLAVYTPNQTRQLRINLPKKEKVDFGTGMLRVTYNNLSGDRVVNSTQEDIPLQSNIHKEVPDLIEEKK